MPKLTPPRRRRWIGYAAAALLLMCVGVGLSEGMKFTNLGGTIIRLFSSEGTLVVEVDDPDVSVTIDGEDIVIKGAGSKEIRVKPGQYKVKVTKGDKEVRQIIASVAKNGREVVRISREEPIANVVPIKDKTPFANEDYALEFDENCHVVLASLKVDTSRPFTMECWVKPYASDPAMSHPLIRIASRTSVRVTGGQGKQWTFGMGETAKVHSPLEQNQRVHLAAVRTEKELRLYVDGKLASKEIIDPAEAKDTPAIVHLGASEKRQLPSFAGILDEVRISQMPRYDKDFTPARRFEPDKDTLALYHFDEGTGDVLKDSSGNNHHGKIVGAKWVNADGTPIAPPVDYALEFDANSHVDLPPMSLDRSAPFTIESYVTPAADDLGESTWIMQLGSGTSLRMAKIRWVFTLDGKEKGAAGPEFNRFVRAKQKVHLAGVRTEKELRLYVDGVLVAQAEADWAPKKKDSLLVPTIGGRTSHPGEGMFRGIIDEVRFSKVARYDKNFTPEKRLEPDKDTLALYHFDEGTGDVLKDSSGNGHHGKIVGAKWVMADGTPISRTPAAKDKLAPYRTALLIEDKKSKFTFAKPLKLDSEMPNFCMEGWFTPRLRDLPEVDGTLMSFGYGTGPGLTMNGGKVRIATPGVSALSYYAGSIKPDQRFHVAAVRDGNRIRLYLNGKLLKEATLSGKEFGKGKADPLVLGDSNSFHGLMEEIRISKASRYDKEFTPAHRFETDADTLALYHFDEGSGDVLKDSSGNGHHGKIVGAKWVKADGTPIEPGSTVKTRTPSSDYALRFEKTSSVRVDSLTVKKNDSFTIEAYVTPSPMKTNNIIHFVAFTDGPGLFLRASNGTWNCTTNTATGFAMLGKPMMVAAVPGQRVHLAAVRDLTSTRLYVDGKLVDTGDGTRGIPYDATGSLVIGAGATHGGPPGSKYGGPGFEGVIDEVRISKVALYDKDFIPSKRLEPDAETLALYHFDEGAGDVLTDSSGNGHHGKIVGARWVKADGTPMALPLAKGRWALQFDDTEKTFATLPNLGVGPTEPLTIECYATPQAKRPDNAGADVLHVKHCMSLHYFTSQFQQSSKWQLSAHIQTAGVTPAILNQRVHLAGVFTGKEARFYVDGTLVQSKAISGDKGGANPSIIGKGFPGLIEEVRISKDARYDKNFVPAQRLAPDKDTIALYHFDEGLGDVLTDSSGNGHHGKIVGAKWVKADGTLVPEGVPTVPSPFTTALAFDGEKSHVTIPTLERNAHEPITLEAWVRPLVGIQKDAMVLARVAGKAPCQIHFSGRPIGLERTLTEKNIGVVHELHGDLIKDMSSWMHIAYVIDAKEARMYVNGKASGRFNGKGRPDVYNPPLVPGTCIGAFLPGYFFHGELAGFRFSKTARYSNDFTPAKRFEPDKDTLALYHFDEGSGDVLKDSSGNGHHGKIVGAKWVKADGAPIAQPDDFKLVRTLTGPESIVQGLTILPDGQRAISSGWDGIGRLWDIHSGKELKRYLLPFKLPSNVNGVAASPDGKVVALATSAYNVHSFDLESGKPLVKYLYGGHGAVMALAFTPDSKGLLFASGDGAISHFTVGNSKATRVFKGEEGAACYALLALPGNKSFLATVGKQVVLFDLNDDKPVRTFDGSLRTFQSLALHPDGQRILGGSHRIFVWDLQTAKTLHVLDDPERTTHAVITGLAITPDGRHVIGGSSDRCLIIWDLTTGKITHRLTSKTNSFNRIALTPDGRHLLTGGGGRNDPGQNFKLVLDGDFDLRLYQLPVTPAGRPIDEAWVKAVAAMPADQQVNQVIEKLKELNPGFDGKIKMNKSDGDVVTELTFPMEFGPTAFTVTVTDITPLRALTGLRKLAIHGVYGNGKLTDISPIKDLKLTHLDIAGHRKMADLSALKDMPLTELKCQNTQVTDLSPLKGMKLTVLVCAQNKLNDLSALQGMPLQKLDISATIVSDLAPLRDMPLAELDCRSTDVSDTAIDHLRTLTKLVKLDLRSTKMTSQGIETLRKALPKCTILWTDDPDHRAAGWVLSMGAAITVRVKGKPVHVSQALKIGKLPEEPFALTFFTLNSDKVTDADLAVFSGCRDLEGILLGSPHVTDAGLVHFKDCHDLTVLSLHCGKVGDAGMIHFKACKKLKSLGLQVTRVTDSGLAHFAHCTNLESLDLTLTRVNDAGLAHFRDCRNLTQLILDRASNVTDAGIAHFKDCKNLAHLNVKGTKLTPAKIDELQKALPRCKIEWDGGTIEPTGSTFPPLDPAWLKSVAAMTAKQQLEAVKAELMKRNPEFDGKLSHYAKGQDVLHINFSSQNVKDITPLAALPQLQKLHCTSISNTPGIGKLSDLSPLKGLKLTELSLSGNVGLSDLSPLAGMPLNALVLHHTGVSSLAPLRAMPLTILDCSSTNVSELAPLKDMKLTSLHCKETPVADLSPLKGMPLESLICQKTKVTDLEPLRGMPLTHLNCDHTQIKDVTPLKGMKLTVLYCGNSAVADLSPLRGMPLTTLNIGDSHVTDVGALEGMPLKMLFFKNTRITDLSVLRGMPLERIELDYSPKRDSEVLRSIKTITMINSRTPEQFWKQVDGK